MSAPSGQTFPCRQCGAQLTYDAATRGMVCGHCGLKEAVAIQPAPGAQGAAASLGIREIPLEQGMQLAMRGMGTAVTTIQCNTCGATVNVGQGERTTKCAFCGSQTVLQVQTNEAAIRPESLVPFAIAREAANERFGAWLAGLWFRPSNLKKMAKVQEMGGVYVPYWTFNAAVASQWTAQRGWHYYETEYYQTTENNQTVTRERQVQRTRWEPAWGARNDFHQNILVCAGRGLPPDLSEKVTSFNVRQLVPYRPDYLAGWRAEQYSLDLMPGWQQGMQKMVAMQEGLCGRDVGGDTHQSLSVTNTFSAITFKHVLLPIWIAAYQYGGKAFQFLVNGQTGEVVGKAPWSVVKITLAILAAVLVIGAGIAIYLYFSQQQ
jgi:DNA-directed RNA polymerase subunit RPC12/RpoP